MPIDVVMTQLSPTMTEGKIARWLKKEGDTLESGDVMVEVETDKATMEVEVIDEGILHKIYAPEGSLVAVGEPIAVIADEDESIADDYQPQAGSAAPGIAESEPVQAEKATPAAQPTQAAPMIEADSKRIKASPLARRLARQKGLSLAVIKGSGPKGRIVKADIEKAVRKGISLGSASLPVMATRPMPVGPLPYHEDEYERLENSMMRKAIARRLTESKQQIPHFYVSLDVHMDRLMDLRAQLNEAADGDFRLSVNDFIIKAVAKALVEVPEANASWTDTHTLQHKHAHISIAVAIDGGLITPVLRYAEQKGIVDLSSEIKTLAGRAREGDLKPEEYSGGTFSISNLGMFGIKHFSAIVNPPEGAILAVGATQESIVAEQGKAVVKQVMNLTLSCDHRVIDGAVAANFLAAVKRLLEKPAGLLL